ncbi:TonB-dependent receptor [Sphingobacterium hungaricum]|uniref:TonB-dependent receptor n=1 Tax=Sphingobacterium hungaricum TaxID=2082723 RepID=A0A928V0H7_9SPHI|nr:TonB-dependent receptor [Sphingobacterium hungaricum]MBE8714711.1 TonB-dependent receptor [Sphingobacterium hungaricum]
MKHYLLILLLLISSSLFAQNTILKGKILDGSDKFSLPGATLKIDEGNRYTISDATGNFEFLNIPEGTYTLHVDYLGYSHYTQKVTVSRSNNRPVEIILSPASNDLEEVQVIGDIAKGQAKALNQQRNNSNISNIISSDQVGRFPDQNIGDALKRVPGITMQNDQGEARNIIIRGLSPELNSVSLNGDRIPSAEGDNRNVQMDLIPSEMISSIEVNKTLTPDMDADAIGGSVNLVTRATPNQQRISATLSGGYAPIRGKGLYNGAFIYGNRFAENKIGLVLSGTIQSQNFGSDNIEAVWKRNDDGSAFVEEMDIRKYDVQRIRRSFSLSTDYEINLRNRLEFNAIYNWRDDRENRYRLRYTDLEWDDAENGYVGSIRRQTKGGIDNSTNNNTRLERQEVYNFSLKGEHLLSSKFDMDWAASYSKASEKRPNERYIEYEQEDVVLGQNLSNTHLPLILDNYTNYADFELREISENNDYTSEDEFGFKLNFRFPLSVIDGQKGRFRFGTRFRAKQKERNNMWYEYSPVGDFGNLASVPNVTWPNNFSQGSQYNPGAFVDKAYLGGLDLTNTSQFESEAIPSEYLTLNYKAKEYITAGYVRWDQNFSEKTSMILGARVEHTKIDYTGNYIEDEDDLVGEVNNKNDYINILPSISFKHDVTKNFILRAAVTTSLARPNYYALAPFVSSMPSDQALSAGNPNLKATYATNVDFMLENYFQNVGLFSAGVFYKNLQNFIYKYSDINYNAEKFANDFPDINNPIPTGDVWEFDQFRNGDKVDVYGLEVAFQRQLDFLPGKFLKGFGIYTNYTFTASKAKGITNDDGEERDGLGLPRTAPHMFNGSISWENNKFSARISGNFTSAYLDEIGADDFTDSYYDKQFFLDANASYKITKQLRIFAEANNLTNQPLRYYQGDVNRMMQLEYYQPRYTLGLKFDL